MKTKKMMALVLAGMAVCSQVRGQQTMTINGQTVILSNMKKNGVSTTDAEAAKVLGDGLRSFGVVKPGDTVVVGDQNATTESNQAIGSVSAVVQGRDTATQAYEVVPIAAPDSPGMIIAMNYKQPLLQEYVGKEIVWRGRRWLNGAGSSNVIHIMKVGDQHFNLSLARSTQNPLAGFVAGAMVEIKGKLAPDYNVFRQYGTSQYLLFLEDGATASLLTKASSLPVSSNDVCSLCGGVPDIVVHTPPMAAAMALLPPFQKEVRQGSNPMRLQNDQPMSYVVGLRSGENGKDVEVPSKGSVTLYLPASDYQVYVYFAAQPRALFQAHDFTLPAGKFPDLVSGELNQVK